MLSKFFSRKVLIIAFISLLGLLVASYLIWKFYFSSYVFNATENLNATISSVEAPSDSYISDNKIVPSPLRVNFSYPAARVDLSSQEVKEGISIYPGIRGTWSFAGDSLLIFTPETNWLPGTEYSVRMDKKIFNPAVKIKDLSFKFKSPDFKGQVISQEFYENPAEVKNKAVVATFSFNYPLDTKELQNQISIKTIGGESYGFSYKLSNLDTTLSVLSSPVKIKSKEDFAEISVSEVKNAYNQKPLAEKLVAKITIPSSSTFFKVSSIRSSIVRNEQKSDNPEQILFVNFSTSVNSAELKSHLNSWYSPKACFKLQEKLGISRNSQSAFGPLKEVTLEEVSLNPEGGKNHLFKYDLNKHQGCLVVKINKGLSSVEGFTMPDDTFQLVSLAQYPLEAKVAFEGSILALNGSRQLAFVSRGVKELKVRTARIETKDLNHLVTQTYGDFSHPYFRNYSFDENNISEIFEKTLPINVGHPAHPSYSSLDLNPYFERKKGVFLISLKGYADKYNFSPEDRRLVMITDLGIVVKDNLDKTHDLFVSSISKGEPVKASLVEVLGKNGLPILKAETNAEGLAAIPDFSNFKDEKEAVVYKVTYENDVSYLPINRADRRLNFSRFEVGGEYDYDENPQALKGYAFSDRGIYRPGEEAHFGIIIRQKDLKVPSKLPLTIEINNANGDVIATQEMTADEMGYLDYNLALERTAITGNYTLNLFVKEKKGRRYVTGTDFKVEEFTPDNLRLKVDWSNNQAKGWFTGNELQSTVSLHNLYGNPAADHELKASYRLTPAVFSFKEFPEYTFRDPLREGNKIVRSYDDELPATKTDDYGAGVFKINLADFEKGTYRLNLKVQGFELGSGRGVNAYLSALVSPNPYLIGRKTNGDMSFIKKDSEHQVEFVAIDNNLSPIAKDNLFLSFYQRQYISSLVEMPDGTYRYQMVPKEQVIQKEAWKIGANGEQVALLTSQPGEFYVQIEDEQGLVLAKVDYNVAGAGNISHVIDKDASLGVKLNHPEYNQGDEIQMQITAPYNGYGLITIERDSVYAYKWFKIDSKSTLQTIALPDTVEGNAYVSVALFRDLESAEIYMPSISYAAVPFSINRDKRHLDINLEVPEVVKPGSDLVVKYSTSHPSKIIVYGVNQGILQVARYKLPNPLADFMKKKALRVITSQIMDLILPDIRILRTLTSTGGDDSYEAALAANLNPFARRQDKPVAFWSGILEASEKPGEYTYRVPEFFNGEIKVMAVAVSEERFGNAEKSVLSRGDFAIIPSGPFNVSPEDDFVIGVSVGNLIENSGNDYPVKVSLAPNKAFAIQGETTTLVKLKEKGEALVKFRLKVLNQLGPQELMFTAQAEADQSKSSRMPYTMSIRPAVPYSSNFMMGHEKSSLRLKDFVEPMYAEFRDQSVSASASPLVLAQGLLKYLDKFPHFCTEQTISKVFPVMEVFFKYPELVENLDVYALFDNAIAKLRERQTLDGGFSAWTVYGMTANEFDSIYATHFLVKAKQQGFNVPENMLNKALSYAAIQAGRSPRDLSDEVPAYAAYVLTLSGQVTTNYLVNLEQFYNATYPKKWKQSINSAFLASSYALLKDEVKARRLIGEYKFEKTNDFANDGAYLYLMAQYFPQDFASLKKSAIQALLTPLQSGRFNTLSSSYAILAFNAFDETNADKDIIFTGFEPAYTPFPTVLVDSKVTKLDISAPEPFFYVVSQQGFSKNPVQKAQSDGLEVSKIYIDKQGNPVTKAKLGDELTVKLAFRALSKEAISDVALVDLLPGCVEIVSNSLNGGWSMVSSDIREDRANVYVTASPDLQEVSYKVKVVAEGDFVVPALYGSALYNPLVRAHSQAAVLYVGE